MDRRLTLPLLLLLLATGPLAAQDVYRIEGSHASRGRWTGQLTLDPDPQDPQRVTVHQELDFATGPTLVRHGSGTRQGNLIVVALQPGGGGATTVLTGTAPASGSRLLLMLNGDLLVSRADVPGDMTRGRGERLDWHDEADLDAARGAAFLAEFRQNGRFGAFTGKDGIEIQHVTFREPNERGAVVFCNGRTETMERYAEVVHDLRGMGYSVYMLDHRGQGRSGRLLGAQDAPGGYERQKGHVADFDDYVEDLKTFMDTVVLRDPHPRLFGAGHSMGGAIVSRYAQLHPGQLDALVLFAPMLELPLTWWEKRAIGFMCLIGKGKSYARGKTPWDPAQSRFATTESTHSRNRYDFKETLFAGDPTLWIGGPTYKWVYTSHKTVAKVVDHADDIDVPVLLFQAEEEQTVKNRGQDRFAREHGDTELVVIGGGLHSLLLETDPRRDDVLNRTIRFLDRETLR